MISEPLTVLELHLLSSRQKNSAATERLFRALHNLQARAHFHLSIEIVATHRSALRFLFVLPKSQTSNLQRLVEAYSFDFLLKKVADYQLPNDQEKRLIYFKFSRNNSESLKTDESQQNNDPLAYLLTTFLHLEQGEQIVYQLIIQPQSCEHRIGSKQLAPPLRVGRFALQQLGQMATACLRVSSPEKTEQKVAIGKMQQPLFRSCLRILISSTCRQNALNYEANLLSALSLFKQPTGQSLQPKTADKKRQWQAFANRCFFFKAKSLLLSPLELANLYHLPSRDSLSSAFMPHFQSRKLPLAPALLQKNHQVVLGKNHYQNRCQDIVLTAAMRRRHVYIVGGSGTGKTTLLRAQALADILAGRGLAVIDPHGDLAQYLQKRVPKRRQSDLIYFDPADSDCQLGINLLSLPENLEGEALEEAKDLRTEALVSVLRKVFKSDGEEMGHRIEYVLRNTIQTAYVILEPNLFTLFKILNDTTYKYSLVKQLKDPYLKMFWRNEIGQAGAMQKVKMQAGVTAKIGRFIFSTSVKKAFNKTAEECLDIPKIINDKKILICNFAKGRLGEDASQLFSASVLAQIQLAVLEQVRTSAAKRPDFYLYVDEFQHFATSSFREMLAEARKYGLNLIMAQQSLQQQSDYKLTESILANVSTIVVFRTGSAADTKLLLPLFEPFLERSDLVNLPSYNFYIKSHGQKIYPPASGITEI